jgi:hypothetical protein
MNPSISSAVNAADLLALARLDDDGAPPAVSPSQPAGGQRSHATRVVRTGQPAASHGSDRVGPSRLALPTAPRGRKAAARDTAISRSAKEAAPPPRTVTPPISNRRSTE